MLRTVSSTSRIPSKTKRCSRWRTRRRLCNARTYLTLSFFWLVIILDEQEAVGYPAASVASS